MVSENSAEVRQSDTFCLCFIVKQWNTIQMAHFRPSVTNRSNADVTGVTLMSYWICMPFYCVLLHNAFFFYFISFLITLLEPYFILLFCIFSQSLVLFVLALFYLKQSFQKSTLTLNWEGGVCLTQPSDETKRSGKYKLQRKATAQIYSMTIHQGNKAS